RRPQPDPVHPPGPDQVGPAAADAAGAGARAGPRIHARDRRRDAGRRRPPAGQGVHEEVPHHGRGPHAHRPDRLETPGARGTRAPLALAFPKALDRMGLERRLKVLDGDGKEVRGRIEVGAGERSWAFHPANPWRAAGYRVEVDRELEDVAGNTPARAFDVDL